MVGCSKARRATRRRKRAVLAAALCSASFFTGHVLFGDEPAASAPSLLSQYLAAKSDLVATPPPKPLAADKKKEQAIAHAKAEEKKTELTTSSAVKLPVATAGKPTVTILPSPPQSPPKLAATPPLEKLDSAKPPANDSVKAEAVAGATLRPAAVSAAADLPFDPAQPSANAVRPALAQSAADTKPTVAHTSAVASSVNKETPKQVVVAVPQPAAPIAPHPSAPATIENAAAVKPQSPSDENLPPIVPAWAVPRPGTKKPAAAAVNTPAPTAVAYPQTIAAAVQVAPSSPAPLRIELGGTPAASPVVAPAAPQPPAPATPAPTNKRADINSLQRLPAVVALTPRPGPQLPAVGARAPSREPLLLPPVDAAQPIPLEIRNPHVAQASFQLPAASPAAPVTARQHLDDE